MTSEGNSALLPGNVDRRPPLLLPVAGFLFVLYNKSLNEWSLGKQLILFPSNFNVSLGCASRKQNQMFPLGPVIKCLLCQLVSCSSHDLVVSHLPLFFCTE